MGNAQSAADQPHNRLVKPRTNKNSPSLAQNNESPASLGSRHTYLSTKERQEIKSQLLSPIRTSFGDRSFSEAEEALGDIAANVQRRLSSISRSSSLSCFGSKASAAAKLSNLPASSVSLVTNSRPVDLATAITILQEVQRNASPEDMAALQQALQPYAPSSSPYPAACIDPSLSRRTSTVNSSTSSLTRRRSLIVTPGIATRNSPIENNRRTWNSWRTPQLQPQEEAKWRGDMMGSPPLAQLAALNVTGEARESPTPRARTPVDMEYSHLGSLKLGSLRIANGEPSPATKMTANKHSANIGSQDEDYFAASDDCDSPIMMKPAKRRGHVRSISAFQPTRSFHHSVRLSKEVHRARVTSHCDSPTSPGRLDELLHEDAETVPVRRLRIMNKSIDTLARIANSREEDTVERQEFTEQERAVAQDVSISSDGAKSFQAEAIRILDGTIFSEPAGTSVADAFQIPLGQRSGKHSEGECASKRPLPKKADSGYSSGGSLKKNGRATNTFPIISKPLVVADLNISEKDPRSRIPAGECVVSRPDSFSQEVEFCPRTPVSVVSRFSIDSKATIQRRLQKRRSSIQDLPIVQCYDPIPEGSIPSIPLEVRNQFTRRLSEAPGMDCLTQTYPTKDHVCSEENGDDLPVVAITFPSPLPSSESRGRHHRRAATERPSSPRGIRRSLSLLRRKSKQEEKQRGPLDENTSSSVLDLGTTAASLGRSPYDVALVSDQQKRATSPTHPHQLRDALPRAKSMVNMDSQTAAKLARLRSRDRTQPHPAIPRLVKSSYDSSRELNVDAQLDRLRCLKHRTSRVTGTVGTRADHQDGQHLVMKKSFGSDCRSRKTGNEPMVTRLTDISNNHSGKVAPHRSWEVHSRSASQRRRSMSEGLREHAVEPQSRCYTIDCYLPGNEMVVGGHSGGPDYGYEGRSYGMGGSAVMQQPHDKASHKIMQFRHQNGVYLSDVNY